MLPELVPTLELEPPVEVLPEVIIPELPCPLLPLLAEAEVLAPMVLELPPELLLAEAVEVEAVWLPDVPEAMLLE